MNGKKQERLPRRLLAAQERVTPLAPHLCILRGGKRLTVLTDAGLGISTYDGKWLYGDTMDPLRAPSGVKIGMAEAGHRRFYVTAMPDFAAAERDYLAGRRRVRMEENEVWFYACRDGLELTQRVYMDGEEECRQLWVHNRSNHPREVMVCVSAEAPSSLLRLRLLPLPEGAQFTGGARKRLRWPLLLPAGGRWEGTLRLVADTMEPIAPVTVRPSEPELPPESVQLCARLYPVRTTAAFVGAVEELAISADIQPLPPTEPFVRLVLRDETRLSLLRAYLRRLSRWRREGIPTALTVAAPLKLWETVAAMAAAFPTVPVQQTTLEEEPALWRALCCWDAAKDSRLPAAVAVAFAPLPLRALSGGSLRRAPRLPTLVGVCPGTEWLLLKRNGVLYSLLHGERGVRYTLPDGLRVMVVGDATADRRRFEVRCVSRSSRPETLELAYYAEPCFTDVPAHRSLTLSRWEQEEGVLYLTHPLAPTRQLTLSVRGGADSFDCDRAAFWCGEWGGRRPCPLRLPGASVTCVRRLPPQRKETVVFEVTAR